MLYLVSFLRYSEMLVENRDFIIPLAFYAPVRGVQSQYWHGSYYCKNWNDVATQW